MNIPLSVDKYLIIAHQKGFIEINGNAVMLTDSGKNELATISEHCTELLCSSLGSDFSKVSDSLASVYGRKFSDSETVQMIMISMLGTEARLLAFLLNERETNYNALREAIKESKSSLSKVEENVDTASKVKTVKKKPKFDA